MLPCSNRAKRPDASFAPRDFPTNMERRPGPKAAGRRWVARAVVGHSQLFDALDARSNFEPIMQSVRDLNKPDDA
jgi:hypothetical protein